MDILSGVKPWLFHALVTLLLLFPAMAQEQPAEANEYELKAAFLFNFAKFVEWPPGTFSAAGDPIHICVLGPNPFGDALARLAQGRVVQSRRLQVERSSNQIAAGQCQIVFIPESNQRQTSQLVRNASAVGTLTVGESESFARDGGVINFVLRENRVGFEINVDAARRGRLQISSKLLNLATIVHDAASEKN